VVQSLSGWEGHHSFLKHEGLAKTCRRKCFEQYIQYMLRTYMFAMPKLRGVESWNVLKQTTYGVEEAEYRTTQNKFGEVKKYIHSKHTQQQYLRTYVDRTSRLRSRLNQLTYVHINAAVAHMFYFALRCDREVILYGRVTSKCHVLCHTKAADLSPNDCDVTLDFKGR
jgi:hypothetical protein